MKSEYKRGIRLGLVPPCPALQPVCVPWPPAPATPGCSVDSLAGSEIEDLVDILALQADVVEPSESDDPTLADADDQPVLGTLIAALQAARADYLITGDKALLALGGRYPIVTPAAFWAAHGGV